MEIRYYLNGLEVKEETKEYLAVKLRKLQKFLDDGITVVEIEIECDKKGYYRVEAQVRIPGNRYIANNVSETIEAACDLVYDELANQIKRASKKRRTLRKRAEISIKKRFVIDEGARFRKNQKS